MSETLIDVAGWVAIIAWISASVYTFFNSNADMFQALGAVGICVGVAYFVVQRHADPHPAGQIDAEAQILKHQVLVTDVAISAHAKVTLLARALVLDAKRKGLDSSPTIEALSEPSLEGLEAALNTQPTRFEEKIDALAVQRNLANVAIKSGRRRSEILQATVVIMGTLQTGFGQFLFAA